MVVKLRVIWIFLWILRATMSCEDSFEIGSEVLEPGNKFVFKNNSVLDNQHLTWAFKGRNKEKLFHSVVMSPTGDILRGLFKYQTDENSIKLAWIKQDNNNITYASSGELGRSVLKWKIVLRNCQKFEYQSEGNGNWWYNIGDVIFTNTDEKQREFDNSGQQTDLKRTKRASEETEAPVSEDEPWYKKLYNFFFGSGSARRDESVGVFTGIMNWVRDLSCKLNGPCDRDEPIGDNQPLTPDFVTSATPLVVAPLPNATEDDAINQVPK